MSYTDQFHVMFGCSGQATAANCHTPATAYLEKDLNQTGSIVHLAKVSYFVFLCTIHTCVPRLNTAEDVRCLIR